MTLLWSSHMGLPSPCLPDKEDCRRVPRSGVRRILSRLDATDAAKSSFHRFGHAQSITLSYRPVSDSLESDTDTIMHIALTRTLPVLAAGLFAACAVHAQQAPATITEQRSVGAFNAIELSGPFEVAVRTEGRAGVALSGERAQLDEIEVFVRDATLVVRPLARSGFHFDFGKRRQSVTVNIGAPQLASLRMAGSGDVTLDGISGERFTLAVAGPGDLRASGAVRELTLSASGSGDADLRRVRATNVDLTLSGPGDVRLANIGNDLRARLSGSGDLEADGLRLARLDAQMSGPGNARLAGSSRQVQARVTGSSDLDACELAGETVTTLQSGPGNACIGGPIAKLDSQITGSGDLQLPAVQAREAVLRMKGPGNANLGGKIGKLQAELGGSGELEGDALRVTRALVTSNGPGDVVLGMVDDTLEAHLSGSGKLSAAIEGKRLLLNANGPGGAQVRGRVALVRARMSGSGTFDGHDLNAERADIAVSGPGNAKVNVTGETAGRGAPDAGQLLVVDRNGRRHAPE